MSSIDPAQLLGYEFEPEEVSYTRRDAALYALGIGVGQDPLSPHELQFVYEASKQGFRVFPTYSAALGFGFLEKLRSLPGLEYDPMMLVHGEHNIQVKNPLPISGRVNNFAKIVAVWDKGSGALIKINVESKEGAQTLAENEYSLFIRGLGSFGGERGPSAENLEPPDQPSRAVVEEKTSLNQALLYRLSGDTNPLHVDPEMAARGGFERPILHGLSVFGYAARAVLKHFSNGQPDNFLSMKTRFTNSVFPGETLSTQMWNVGDAIYASTKTLERGVNVALSRSLLREYSPLFEPLANPA